jgi:hypothetical protein
MRDIPLIFLLWLFRCLLSHTSFGPTFSSLFGTYSNSKYVFLGGKQWKQQWVSAIYEDGDTDLVWDTNPSVRQHANGWA